MQLHPLVLERCLDPVASSGALLFENHVLVQVALQQMALLAVESDAFSVDGLRHYLRDTISHAEHSLCYVEAIEARLPELHQQHLLVLQDRTSSRLKLLTILSAVFMPLTLITGIYGMNFRTVPELGSAYSYPLVLLLMLRLATGLLAYF